MGFEGRRLRKAGVIDIVCGPPRVIDPVWTDLEHVVGVVEVVQNQKALFRSLASKLPMTFEVPGVVPREIEAAQTIPCDSLSAASPGHLVERRPDVAIVAPLDGVGIAAMFVPEAGLHLNRDGVTSFEPGGQFVQIFGLTGLYDTWREAADA